MRDTWYILGSNDEPPPSKRKKKTSQRSASTHYKHAEELREWPTKSLSTALSQKMKDKGYSGAANIVCRLAVNPELGDTLVESLKKKAQPDPMSYDRAVGKLYAMKFTKIQYIKYSIDVNSYSGQKMVPSYTDLRDYRQSRLQLHSSDSVYTETEARVPLQDLLNFTILRIDLLESFYSVVEKLPKHSSIFCYYKVGYDGSTGFRKFKQRSEQGLASKDCDGSMLATYLVCCYTLVNFGAKIQSYLDESHLRNFRLLDIYFQSC